MDPSNTLLFSPQPRACSQLAESPMDIERSPSPGELGRDSPFSWSQVPSCSLTDPDWFGDEHIQAKRARVETIVRGMGLSPSPLVPGKARARDSPCYPEKAQKRKRKQSLPMQQDPLKSGPAGDCGNRKGGPRVREQLHLLTQQLRHLQEHILQAFNRCITSQMIKWFSNFREFYYIQMEKFARQAISDGVTNPKVLLVLRDSELFRVLNMHFNKGNDFEILSKRVGIPDFFKKGLQTLWELVGGDVAKRTQVSIFGKYRTRYGASNWKMVKKTEISQHGKCTYSFCGKTKMKRRAVGIRHCGSCMNTGAGGGAWTHTTSAVTVKSAIRRLEDLKD
ncbi:Prospero homeobox protein 2 [Tupaia chinensis]|uniref:Prospero homeobox protein 2 n=1 Tax=Tupaia chinensis TaxID=246437 RepID=L8Y4L9_TUPCH|nr:Prospero homeobox protein 2 [Tupaia chinensis]